MSHGFTISDIKRYIAGKMSPAEMHLIEKAALEDPFLADAIEGMQYAHDNYGDEKVNSDISDLKSSIAASRNRSRKMMYATWWRVAAGLIVVVTGVAMVYFFNRPAAEKAVTVAKVEQFKQDTPLPAPAPAVAETRVVDSSSSAKSEKKVAPKASAAKVKEFHYQKQQAVRDTMQEVRDEMPLAKEKQSMPAPAEADSTDAVASTLQGRAAGIVITDKSKKEEAEASLEEVVVVGYGANKKRDTNTAPNKHITPEGGWRSFDEYINSNKRIDGADSLITGAEEITFNIDDAGLPFNFKIVRSLSETHDKEAIRLVKEGPTWNVEKGRRRLRLRIKF